MKQKTRLMWKSFLIVVRKNVCTGHFPDPESRFISDWCGHKQPEDLQDENNYHRHRIIAARMGADLVKNILYPAQVFKKIVDATPFLCAGTGCQETAQRK